MGLKDILGRKKPEPEQPKPVSTKEEQEEFDIATRLNIPRHSVKVMIFNQHEGLGQRFDDCYLWKGEDLVRLMQGDTILFELTPKCKAYKEIQPIIGKKLRFATIEEKQGEYGIYYKTILRYKVTRDEIEF